MHENDTKAGALFARTLASAETVFAKALIRANGVMSRDGSEGIVESDFISSATLFGGCPWKTHLQFACIGECFVGSA